MLGMKKNCFKILVNYIFSENWRANSQMILLKIEGAIFVFSREKTNLLLYTSWLPQPS